MSGEFSLTCSLFSSSVLGPRLLVLGDDDGDNYMTKNSQRLVCLLSDRVCTHQVPIPITSIVKLGL